MDKKELSRISSDLERYALIRKYYLENPERIRLNEDYLIDITDALDELPSKGLSSKEKEMRYELFEFFAINGRYV